MSLTCQCEYCLGWSGDIKQPIFWILISFCGYRVFIHTYGINVDVDGQTFHPVIYQGTPYLKWKSHKSAAER